MTRLNPISYTDTMDIQRAILEALEERAPKNGKWDVFTLSELLPAVVSRMDEPSPLQAPTLVSLGSNMYAMRTDRWADYEIEIDKKRTRKGMKYAVRRSPQPEPGASPAR